MRYLLTLSLILLSVGLYAAQEDKVDIIEILKNKRMSVVYAQKKVEAGEFGAAIIFLEKAIEFYPDNDVFLTLLGQAYYDNKDLENAEFYLMEAIKINPLNQSARDRIEAIRITSEYSRSKQSQQIEEVAMDKMGDVVVLALGFFLGSTMGGVFKRFSAWRFMRKSRRMFLEGEYEDFADTLEIQLQTNELRPLRESLDFMLDHKTYDESRQILERYVNSEDNLSTLNRMLKLNDQYNN